MSSERRASMYSMITPIFTTNISFSYYSISNRFSQTLNSFIPVCASGSSESNPSSTPTIISDTQIENNEEDTYRTVVTLDICRGSELRQNVLCEDLSKLNTHLI